MGRTVGESQFGQGNNSIELDLKTLPDGVYNIIYGNKTHLFVKE